MTEPKMSDSRSFPPRGHFGEEEKAAVDALLDEAIETGTAPGYNGREEESYCAEFSTFLGGGFTDAVSSGTAGIYVALRALDLEPLSEVIVGAMTDPGGLMPIPLLNLIPMIADTAPRILQHGARGDRGTPLPQDLRHHGAAHRGRAGEYRGHHGDRKPRGIPVIEDCSQSHGALLHGRHVGTFGDIGVFSTMFGKHHTSGGQGGLVFTPDETLYHTIRRASDRGKPFFLPEGSTNTIASLNFNLNDLAAAIGRVQLRKLPQIIERRRDIAAKLADGIQDLACVSIPDPIEGARPSYWFLRMGFHPEAATVSKAEFCRALTEAGLPVMVDYSGAMPHTMDWFVHRRIFGHSGYPWSNPDYKGDPDRQFPCPNARAAIASHFNLMIHEGWSDQDIEDVLAILGGANAALQRA